MEGTKEKGCVVHVIDLESDLHCSPGARLLLSREEEAAPIERRGDQSPVMWFSSGNEQENTKLRSII